MHYDTMLLLNIASAEFVIISKIPAIPTDIYLPGQDKTLLYTLIDILLAGNNPNEHI